MIKYLAPLGIFIGGNVMLLFIGLFLPAINTVSETLATDTAAIADTFWGWSWVVSGTRFWVFLAVEAAILYATAKSLLRLRR